MTSNEIVAELESLAKAFEYNGNANRLKTCRDAIAWIRAHEASNERCTDCGRPKWQHTPVEDFPCGVRPLALLREMCAEIWAAHRDPDDPGYNECEKAECAWCENTKAALAELESSQVETTACPSGNQEFAGVWEAVRADGLRTIHRSVDEANDFRGEGGTINPLYRIPVKASAMPVCRCPCHTSSYRCEECCDAPAHPNTPPEKGRYHVTLNDCSSCTHDYSVFDGAVNAPTQADLEAFTALIKGTQGLDPFTPRKPKGTQPSAFDEIAPPTWGGEDGSQSSEKG